MIDVPLSYHTEYFERAGEMVNPWGGVEALLTHALSTLYDVPTAHSPMMESREIANADPGYSRPADGRRGRLPDLPPVHPERPPEEPEDRHRPRRCAPLGPDGQRRLMSGDPRRVRRPPDAGRPRAGHPGDSRPREPEPDEERPAVPAVGRGTALRGRELLGGRGRDVGPEDGYRPARGAPPYLRERG